MKNKKTLWNGTSVLIVIVLAITALTRGYVQIGLTAIALIAWSVWATVKFLLPYLMDLHDARESRKLLRKYVEEERNTSSSTAVPVDETAAVLLLHVNHRISSYLKSAYPDATWVWREEDPEGLVARGGTGRIQVYGVADFNYADVTVNRNAEISCNMLKLIPMTEIRGNEAGAEEPAKPVPQNPIDPQVWFERKGRVVLESLITDLHSRGHSSLTIKENGEITILQENTEMNQGKLESMPDKMYWERLAKVFRSEGLTTDITADSLVVSW